MPLIALSFYSVILPWLTSFAGYALPNLMEYGPTKNSFDFKSALEAHKNLPWDLLRNIQIAIMDCFGLTNPFLINSVWGRTLQYSTHLAVYIFIGFFIHQLTRKRNFLDIQIRLFALLFCLYVFNTYALSTIANNIWGLYYYGIYISVVSIIILALIFRDLEESWNYGKQGVVGLTILIVASSLYIFPSTNFVYKYAHYYIDKNVSPAPLLKGMFTNQINRFEFKEKNDKPQLLDATVSYWQCMRKKQQCVRPIPELNYLIVELHAY